MQGAGATEGAKEEKKKERKRPLLVDAKHLHATFIDQKCGGSGGTTQVITRCNIEFSRAFLLFFFWLIGANNSADTAAA